MAGKKQVPLPPGYILAGTYEIREELGTGGFGLTYLAHDVTLDKDVAIKEFMPINIARRASHGQVEPITSGATPNYLKFLANFKEEAQILVRMNHPSIVRVLRWIEANNSAYYVMEHIDGETLGTACKRRSRLPPAAVMLLVEKLLDGLIYMHRNNLLHRDLKPDNIMLRRSSEPADTRLSNIPANILSEFGHPVLIDFGTARVFRGMEDRTLTGFRAPGFTPPEQISPDGKEDERTDIYSLAATAYTVLTGSTPDDSQLREQDDQLRPLSTIMEEYSPAAFLAGLDQGLAMNIRDRPPNMSVWRRQLFPDAYGSGSKPPVAAATAVQYTEIAPGPFDAKPNAAQDLRLPILILAILLLLAAGFFALRQLDQDVSGYGERDRGAADTAVARGSYRATTDAWRHIDLGAYGIAGRYALSSDGPFRIKVGSTVYTVADGRPVDISDTPGAAIELKAIGEDRDVAIASLTR